MIKNLTAQKQLLLLIIFGYFIPCICLARNDSPNLKLLESNELYFIKNIDLNGDKLLDKVVSSKKNQGNELYFFLKTGTTFRFVLQSTNFSEDGVAVINNIHPENQQGETLSILTYFPDGGHLTAQHFIAFKKNDWFLTRTVYKTIHWQQDPTKTTICNIKQNINLRYLTEEGKGWVCLAYVLNQYITA